MKIKKKYLILTTAMAISMAAVLAGCGAQQVSVAEATSSAMTEEATLALSETETETETKTTTTSGDTVITTANVTSNGAIDASDMFTERDLTQTADLTDAVTYTVSDGETITITTAGVYVITGTASNASIVVEAGDEDKVQLVLDSVSITNDSTPCIYVKSADKVFVTTTNSSNSLSVNGTFTADGTTNTDAVIFSKDDLVLNGLGTLTINSSDNAVTSKDGLKITGGSYSISCSGSAFEANDSIEIADGSINISSCNDGLHAENDEDYSVGYIYICGGSFSINAADDGIHATTIAQIDAGTISITAAEGIEATWIQINGGTISIQASDDGINAAAKSNVCDILVEFNGGDITINMGQGDTDAVDSNGSIIINGGTLNINAQSPFDYDYSAQKNGGTLIVNGTETDSITNQMMGGGMMGGDMGDMGNMGGSTGGPSGGMGGMGGGPGR